MVGFYEIHHLIIVFKPFLILCHIVARILIGWDIAYISHPMPSSIRDIYHISMTESGVAHYCIESGLLNPPPHALIAKRFINHIAITEIGVCPINIRQDFLMLPPCSLTDFGPTKVAHSIPIQLAHSFPLSGTKSI